MHYYLKLLLFASLLGQCLTREVTSAQSQIKKVDTLGFPTAIDVLEVEFDEPLELAKTYGACKNRTCASVPSCICDYTSADVCAGNAPNGCNCPVGLTCAINTTLQLGVPFSDYVPPGETKNYKIYIGSQHACKFLHFDLVAENGDPDIYVGTATTFDEDGALGTPDGLPLVQGKYGPESMILCPSDFKDFELGTLVIGIYSFPSGSIAQGVGAQVTVTVNVYDLPPAITPLPCTPEYANHTCIVDDEWVFATTPKIQYYEMALPNECTSVSFLTATGTFIGFSYEPYPELKFESKLFVAGMESGSTAQRGAFVICPQDLGINKIFIAANATRTSATSFSFIVSTNPGWFYTRPINAFNSFQYSFEMLGSAYMSCPTANQSFSCFERLTNGLDCYYFWFVNPTEDPAPFYPRPLFTRGVPNINGVELSDKPSNPLANKFVAVVMLNLTVSLQSRFRISEADLSDCQMKFSGRLLWGSNKQPVQETVTFTPRTEECDFQELDETVVRMNELLDDQESVTTGLELSNIRFQLDTYAVKRNFYNCKEFALSLSSTAVTNVTVDTRACLVTSSSPLYADDPCCNTSIGWTTQNCAERPLTIPLEVYSDITDATDQCYAPRCLSIFAQNFARKSLTVADTLVGCSSNTPNSLNFRAELYEPYQACKESVFGVFPDQGFSCWSDSDCKGSTKCDLVRNKCLYPMSERIDLFVQCFLNDIDPFIRDYIEKENRIQPAVDVGDETNFQQWKSAFTVNDCTNEYDLAVKYRQRWKLIPSFSTNVCNLCPEYACLDKSCTVPYHCNNIGGSCGKVWQAFPTQSCGLLEYCNWINCEDLSTNTVSTCKSDCLDPLESSNFCGVCENGQDCVELTSITTEPDCTSAQACVRHDRTVVAVNSENECSNQLSCSVTCFDGTNDVPCNDDSSCTSSGVCDGDFYVGNGACVTPLNPYNSPACRLPAYAQPYGCVDTTINQTTCESQTGAVWRKKARTEGECSAFGYGCTERRIVANWNNRYYITRKDPDACAAVGGTYGPILTWRAGTYRGGIVRTPTWQARAYTSRYNSAPTFDFFNLDAGIDAAVNVKYSYNLKTETQCLYAQQVQLLNIVTCGCSASGQLSEQCFDNYDPSITDALTIVCQDVGGSISDVDTKIAVNYGSASLESSSLCISVQTGGVSVERFKFSSLNAISTFLINFNSKEDYTFVNTNNAVVGGFIGDGMSFDFEGGALRNFTICVPTIDNAIFQDTDRFPVIDFALVDTDTNNVTPLQIDVVKTEGRVCGTISELVSRNASHFYAYFPIARQQDYITTQRQVKFIDHELALIIICIIFYAFCAAFTLAKAIIIMQLRKWHQLTYVVLLILCALCVVRLLFFLLTVGGAVLSAGDYVIIELPSFLYFSALSFFVIIWMFVARVIKRPNVSRNRINQTITRYVIITNAVIYTIFILLIILYETLKQDVPVCGGRLKNFDLNTRQQIAYTYRLFVSAISFILGLGFIIYGFTVYSNMLSSSARGEKGKSRISGRKRVFWTTFICSVGLLCQCAFLLALLFSNYQNNTLAMGLLIAVEIIPISIVAGVTKTEDSETSYGTTTSPNTSGTKGAKMSTIKNSALSVRSDRMDDDTSKTTTADIPGVRDPTSDNSKTNTGDTNDDADNDKYPSSSTSSSSDHDSSTSDSESSSEEEKIEEDSEQESGQISKSSEPEDKSEN